MSPPSEVEEAKYEDDEDEEEVEEFEEVEEVEEVEEESESVNPNQNLPPILQSISHLQSLHLALSDFLFHYNSLQHTLTSIASSIANPSKPLLLDHDQEQQQQQQTNSLSELESLCRANGAKSLRKYIITHLPEIDRLRREIPEALKLAPNPGRLVFDGMGKFYIQGSKAFDRPNSKEIDVRRAGILLLEFFLISGCAFDRKLVAAVKENGRDAAVSWRGRIMSEGGIEAASAVDALGLVLLLAAFGIPSEFKPKDLYGLLKLSNLKKKGDVLRRSPILVEKMPDIIKDLIAKEMCVEAVNLVCTFGLEEKFPPLRLLSSFVKRACEIGVQDRREAQSSIQLLKEANEKQLAALKSVVKCLEDHKIDATKLASFNINQKISKLEKDILREEQKLQNMNSNVVKRKAEDVLEPFRSPPGSQAKQARSSSAGASHIAPHIPLSIRQIQEQGITTTFAHSRYAAAYNGFIANSSIPSSSQASSLGTAVLGRADGWHEDGALYKKSSVVQSLKGYPNPYSPGSGHNSNLSGYPATAAASHRTGSRNLYQFADTTELERELLANYSSNSTTPASAVADPGHQSSSYYTKTILQSSYPSYPGLQSTNR